MKVTLKDFFTRTAYSRDASDHLLRFHGIPADRFMLLIPVGMKSTRERQHFVSSLRYLKHLDLHPMVLLSGNFLDIKSMQSLDKQLESIDSARPLKILRLSARQDFLANVKKLALSNNFFKYVFVHAPLSGLDGHVRSQIHLSDGEDNLSPASRDMIQWVRPLLEFLGPAYAVQMASAQNLLQELFTSKGAGTWISLGYQFKFLDDHAVPKARLQRLIEHGFNRKLKKNYFKDMPYPWHAIIEKEYRGAVVFMDHPRFTYLDKIVVSPEFYGRGLGSLLFEELFDKLKDLSADRPRLAWRARHDNPYLNRYAAFIRQTSKTFPLLCGTTSDSAYVYHTIGLKDNDRKTAITFMKNLPNTFKDDA